MEELKGFDFRIFWAMAVHKRAVTLQQLNSIKLHPYEHKPSNVEDALNTLLKNDYITETEEKEYKVTNKGTELYKNYCNDLDEIIYDEDFEIALMKFLYDMGHHVPWGILPFFITKRIPQFARGGDINFYYKTYFQDESEYHDKFSVNDKFISLSKEGKRFYEYRIRKKTAEKEKNEKDVQIRDLDYKGEKRNLKYDEIKLWVTIVSVIIAAISIAFNIYQYYKKS